MIKVSYWLNHPTQIDVPVFRILAEDKRISFRVIYCANSAANLMPNDGEVGASPSWGASALTGYEYSVIPHTVKAGWDSANSLLTENRDSFAIIQGTHGPAFRGIIASSLMFGRQIMLRYDATIRYGEPSALKGYLKRMLLPVLWSKGVCLGYTGSWAKEYLSHYGAKDAQTFWYPYTVDQEWLASRAMSAKRERANMRARLNIPSDAVVFFAAVKFVSREAPLDVIKAFCKMSAPFAHLIVAGDGPQRAEVDSFLSSNPKNSGRVHLLGYIRYGELAKYYGISDVFIHPAHVECWGVSVNEAMACALPVVCSDMVGAAADLVEDSVNGYIYQCGNIDSLAAKMDELAANSARLPLMGQNSLRKVEKYAPKITANRLVEWILARK
jgi:glycosyltransferase involved in cell wall biosynthesis